jgi:hypothetical protein
MLELAEETTGIEQNNEVTRKGLYVHYTGSTVVQDFGQTPPMQLLVSGCFEMRRARLVQNQRPRLWGIRLD